MPEKKSLPPVSVTGEPKKKRKKKGAASEVQLWAKKLELGEKKLEKYGGRARLDSDGEGGDWKDLITFYEGKQWKSGEGGEEGTWHRVTSNLLKANIDALRPQLYFQNPKVRVSVKSPEVAQMDLQNPDGSIILAGTPIARIGGRVVNATKQAELFSSIDDYYLAESKVKPKTKRVINDALVLPYGVAKWEWVQVEQESEVAEEFDEDGNITTTSKEKTIVAEFPVYSRIKPWLFIWDSELDEFDLDQAKWCAEIRFQSKAELKEQGFKVEDLPQPEFSIAKEEDAEETPEFQRWKVYYISDMKNDRWIVHVDGGEKFLHDESPHPYSDIEGSNYILLGFDERIDDSVPMALPNQIKSKLQVRNWILSYQANHVARFNRKYKIMKNTMTPAEKTKLEIGGDGTIVETKDMAGGPEPIKDAPISNDSYALSDILKREITEEFGVTAFQRGSREPGAETATEVNKIQSGADVKTEEKREAVKDFMIRSVEKLNQMLQVFLTLDHVTEIVGTESSEWVTWNRRDIQGQFHIDVDIYSAMPFSILEDRRQALEMFSLVQEDPYFDPIKVRQHLRKAHNWPEDVLLAPDEAQAAIQQKLLLEQQRAAIENQPRPNGSEIAGDAQRGSDIVGGIAGGATGSV